MRWRASTMAGESFSTAAFTLAANAEGRAAATVSDEASQAAAARTRACTPHLQGWDGGQKLPRPPEAPESAASLISVGARSMVGATFGTTMYGARSLLMASGVALGLHAACGGSAQPTAAAPALPSLDVPAGSVLAVVSGETGRTVAGASVTVAGRRYTTDATGEI